MSIWPSVIGAGASLLGGLIGSDDAEDSRHAADERQARSDALQKEFAQHGIQWRVADAKAAGIHPVFALQGGGAAYAPSPMTIDGGSPLGDAMWKPFRMDKSGKVWYLPAGDDASDSLESVSESWPMQWMILRENMRRNPYFIAENRHLFPFGEELGKAAEWSIGKYVDVERAAKIGWNKLGHRAQDWIDRQRSYTGGYSGVRRRSTRKWPY